MAVVAVKLAVVAAESLLLGGFVAVELVDVAAESVFLAYCCCC